MWDDSGKWQYGITDIWNFQRPQLDGITINIDLPKQKWTVLKDETLSDHRYMNFSIEIDNKTEREQDIRYNMKRMN